MKNLLIILAVVTMAWGVEFQQIAEENSRSISNQIVDAIESFKQRMPCGFAKYGIPPLAPYKTAHQEIAIDTNSIQIYGEINNFRLDGLNDFDVVNLKVSPLFRRINFKFNWNNVHFETHYNASTAPSGKGLRRSGPAKFSLRNITIWGVLKYNLNVFGGKLSVKELRVYISLGEVRSEIGGLSAINIINKKLNRIIEEWFMMAINDNTNEVAEWSNSMLTPLLNDILSDMSVKDILGMISGGGEEQEPCIPAEDVD